MKVEIITKSGKTGYINISEEGEMVVTVGDDVLYSSDDIPTIMTMRDIADKLNKY